MQIENFIQNLIFQDLATRVFVQGVAFFALWSSALVLLKANGKYNVILRHLTGQCQITFV